MTEEEIKLYLFCMVAILLFYICRAFAVMYSTQQILSEALQAATIENLSLKLKMHDGFPRSEQ